jgi:hypothetical protein
MQNEIYRSTIQNQFDSSIWPDQANTVISNGLGYPFVWSPASKIDDFIVLDDIAAW